MQYFTHFLRAWYDENGSCFDEDRIPLLDGESLVHAMAALPERRPGYDYCRLFAICNDGTQYEVKMELLQGGTKCLNAKNATANVTAACGSETAAAPSGRLERGEYMYPSNNGWRKGDPPCSGQYLVTYKLTTFWHYDLVWWDENLGWYRYDTEWGDVEVSNVGYWQPLPPDPEEDI